MLSSKSADAENDSEMSFSKSADAEDDFGMLSSKPVDTEDDCSCLIGTRSLSLRVADSKVLVAGH